MHSTGHTSTQDVSLVPIHGSVMIKATVDPSPLSKSMQGVAPTGSFCHRVSFSCTRRAKGDRLGPRRLQVFPDDARSYSRYVSPQRVLPFVSIVAERFPSSKSVLYKTWPYYPYNLRTGETSMDQRDRDVNEGNAPVQSHVGHSAIKWSAIVIIVLAILYFLARYVIPLMS